MRQSTLSAAWGAVALFALLSGAAFVHAVNGFLDASTAALTVPPLQPLNVNQSLIRPFLLQVGLAALLVLPLVTAGAYRRTPSGSSWQVAARTFTRSLALYAVMLLAPLASIAALSLFGAPEWAPVLTGWLGMLLIGGAFLAAALFVASLTSSPLAAGCATAAMALMLVAAGWLARAGTPAAQAIFSHVSVAGALDDFAKGVVDTGHVVSCVSVTALALYLTREVLERR
jgi:ABC-2 type transport system permease protein